MISSGTGLNIPLRFWPTSLLRTCPQHLSPAAVPMIPHKVTVMIAARAAVMMVPCKVAVILSPTTRVPEL